MKLKMKVSDSDKAAIIRLAKLGKNSKQIKKYKRFVDHPSQESVAGYIAHVTMGTY